MASSSIMPTEAEASQSVGNKFQPSFAHESLSTVYLDFDSVDANGNYLTYEGRLKEHILHDKEEAQDVIAILGPGGVGKSTIAKGLMNDEHVRRKFSDGVHLISLGMNATPATVFHELCKVMRSAGAVDVVEKLQSQNDVENAIREAISWFSGKRCAFFVDDVWTSEIGTGLISRLCRLGIEEKHCTVVLTTRETDVAFLADRPERIRIDPREPQGREAQQILFCHVGATQNELKEDFTDGPIREVLKACSGLPVCLAVAGKGVRMLIDNAQEEVEDPWAEYLVNIPDYREKLLEEDLNSYGNLYSTFTASLALLDKRQRQKLKSETNWSFVEMYRRLCVLRKQEKVPEHMLYHLWGLESDFQARTIGVRLEQVGLAETGWQMVRGRQVWYLSIHDSLHDFAVSEAKRHGDTASAHEFLVHRYKADVGLWRTEPERIEWWSPALKDDGYIHRNLCRHLRDSQQIAELVDLLQTPQWIRHQLLVNDIWTLHDDFTTGINAILKTDEDCGSLDETALRLIREALVLSFGFISKNSNELWFQLYGRLLGHQERCAKIKTFLWQIKTGLKHCWLRSINPFLESPGSSTIRMINTDMGVRCMTTLEETDRVACGSDVGTVFVVNVMQGVIEKRWDIDNGRVCTIASGRRGTRVITGAADECAVWDVNTGDCVHVYRGHSSRVNSVLAIPNGQHAASASEDGAVQVWHLETGQSLASFTGYGPVRRIAVFPDAKHLALGGADGILQVWNIESGVQVGEPVLGYNKFMNFVALAADGARIVSGSWDEALRIQSASPVEKIGVTTDADLSIELDAGVECVSLSNDGKYVVSGHASGRIRLWDVTTGHPIGSTLEGHSNRIRDISFLGSSDVVVSVSCDGQIRVWDVFRMVQISQSTQEEKITKVLFTPNGENVITGSSDGSLRIWETSSGRQLGRTLTGHAGSISDLALNQDGSHMVSVSNEKDRTVRVWNIHSYSQLAELGRHTGWISSVALTPKCDYVVAGSLDKNLYLWKLTGWDQNYFFSELKGHTEWVLRVYVSNDGNRIISVGDSTEILVWDIFTGLCVNKTSSADPWKFPRERVMKLANEPVGDGQCDSLNSPQGTMIDITVADRAILYGKSYEKTLGTMECDVMSEAFSPDKKMFCIGLRDGQIALMKLEHPLMQSKQTQSTNSDGEEPVSGQALADT